METAINGVTVSIFDEDLTTGQRNDASWYVTGDSAALAQVYSGDTIVSIYAIGEMRINLENGNVIRYTSDLIKNGITNDKELADIPSDLWVNNAWYEVFTDDEPYSEIFHDITEAMEYAVQMAASKIGSN